MTAETDSRQSGKTAPARHATQQPDEDELRQAYEKWWHSAGLVHDILEQDVAKPIEVTERFQAEYDTRRSYASLLRHRGRDVPDYLAADKAFPPRWPVPEPPSGD
ncbi:hypothetical protein [Fodinicola acaciae]|uniref:hypothetical protein n=1 Tax=Fodinicola acaciae TaxID=2681555 RepID=UPI0013D2311B|nr:hypothetical protein [Fodinicola acaciae]